MWRFLFLYHVTLFVNSKGDTRVYSTLYGADMVAQLVEAIALKPNDLSLSLRTRIKVKG